MDTTVFVNDITSSFTLESVSYPFLDPGSVTKVVGWAGRSH